MITDKDIERVVAESLTAYTGEFDVRGIVDEVIARYGRVDIETIDHDDYWTLVAKHAAPEDDFLEVPSWFVAGIGEY